jgi:Transposase DDE domain group 1
VSEPSEIVQALVGLKDVRVVYYERRGRRLAQNRIRCAIVTLAVEVTGWMQMLAVTDPEARRSEPTRLRMRLFAIPTAIARDDGHLWVGSRQQLRPPAGSARAVRRVVVDTQSVG